MATIFKPDEAAARVALDLLRVSLDLALPCAQSVRGRTRKVLKHVFSPEENWHQVLPGGACAWAQDWNVLRVLGALDQARDIDERIDLVGRCPRAQAIVERRALEWHEAAARAVADADRIGPSRVNAASSPTCRLMIGTDGVIAVVAIDGERRLVSCWREPRVAKRFAQAAAGKMPRGRPQRWAIPRGELPSVARAGRDDWRRTHTDDEED